jgi:hypothetical protein
MDDRGSLTWFPDLRRVECKADRREVWRAAYNPVLKSVTYWLIAIGAQVLGQAVFRIISWQCAPFAGSHAHWIRLLAPGIGAIAAGVLTLWLVRRRITLNVRQQLVKLGLPTCLSCGYDLTGNTSGACPECGTGVGRP